MARAETTTPTSVPLLAALVAPVRRLMPELSYYTIVSAIALGVDIAIFTGLTAAGTKARWAGVIGYAVGLVLHYILSSRYVFDTTGSTKSTLRRFGEFVVSGLVGIAITWTIIAIAVDVMHLPPMVGKIAAVGVAFIVVFLLRRGIVFADGRLSRPTGA
ncbi:MAG TPA: GtrA family protein [Hyphomicrobiaceae bacterium]|nr:GtrA family protein [Hyphomicrobiaceae bacterium]